MRMVRLNWTRGSWFTGIAAMLIGINGSLPVAAAAEAELDLLGYRWEKPEVTYWLEMKGNVSPAAVADVLAAIEEWNGLLAAVAGAPSLQPAGNARQADIVVYLRVQSTRRSFGSPNPQLTVGYWGLPVTTGCVLEAQDLSMSGDALALNAPQALVRNRARYLVGLALGMEPFPCPSDVGPGEDRFISGCELAGLEAIYAVESCEDIPASIPCDCP